MQPMSSSDLSVRLGTNVINRFQRFLWISKKAFSELLYKLPCINRRNRDQGLDCHAILPS